MCLCIRDTSFAASVSLVCVFCLFFFLLVTYRTFLIVAFPCYTYPVAPVHSISHFLHSHSYISHLPLVKSDVAMPRTGLSGVRVRMSDVGIRWTITIMITNHETETKDHESGMSDSWVDSRERWICEIEWLVRIDRPNERTRVRCAASRLRVAGTTSQDYQYYDRVLRSGRGQLIVWIAESPLNKNQIFILPSHSQ